ncbi:DNA repair and transcription factor Ada [Cordyceps militaris CM01]|uniref:DNA repair and transcription factor Ada n=1 Tax=Cordyceps militaris (strain CM01) TaxID=983644 RepID=G3JQD9_CORMM|nr:DNA repair and transcription factor Ada [Cordyceps militaris CM01]EGX89390.1 DNA repair and transcription factor Ada [Cordyceps militaris CM01]
MSQALPFTDEARRWQAVQDRDGSADGLFVYAVKTTKIYCRPICKARLARRANVSFYDTGRAAQAAGFRACKRCKPELAGAMPAELAVGKIRAFVEEQQRRGGGGGGRAADTRLSLSQMARQTGLSKWHFHRVFKRCVGVTPGEFLRCRGEVVSSSSTSPSSLSPPASGTLSPPPWTHAELGSALGWPAQGDEMGGYHDVDLAMLHVESAGLLPWNDNGFGWDDANLSFDDFLLWPEETCKNA